MRAVECSGVCNGEDVADFRCAVSDFGRSAQHDHPGYSGTKAAFQGLPFLSVNCAVARMVWLVVVISLNGRPPQVIEQVPFESMQGCQAEKALRDSRQSTFFVPNETSIRRAIFCSDDPGRDLKLY
jgi:hypothetical protein